MTPGDEELNRNHCLRSLYKMLIHGSHVYDLRCEKKFEVCDRQSFQTLLIQ